MSTIQELVRAAKLYASARKGTHLELQRGIDLGAAADTLDTSGEVVVDRAQVQRIFDYLDTGAYDMDELQDAADHLGAALKEQS